jgi:hypothetical protein
VRWAGHEACMGEMKNAFKIWQEKLNRKNQSEELGVGRKIILE